MVKVTVVKLIAALVLGLFAAPLVAGAQQAGKVYRIGYLTAGSPGPLRPVLFEQALRERGWVTGKNLVIAYRYAEGKDERLADLAAELAQLPVDVIVALATPSALAAKRVTATIPIVIMLVTDPARRGLIASLPRPGGNVTGMTYLGHEVFTKGLELLKEAVPGISRVAVFMQATDPAQMAIYSEVDAAARVLGVSLHLTGVRSAADLDNAIAAVLSLLHS